jgi:hypothetical protein
MRQSVSIPASAAGSELKRMMSWEGRKESRSQVVKKTAASPVVLSVRVARRSLGPSAGQGR